MVLVETKKMCQELGELQTGLEQIILNRITILYPGVRITNKNLSNIHPTVFNTKHCNKWFAFKSNSVDDEKCIERIDEKDEEAEEFDEENEEGE